jgi:NADPH:quinone reductase-like Zn-dependent oxidoreductase
MERHGVGYSVGVQAIALTEYGGPDVLSLTEVDDPPVGPDRVLVRVHAAGVNPVDTTVRAGGLRDALPHHEPLVPGFDMAGVVERVGAAVTGFAVGDCVIGYVRQDHLQYGTYAELVSAPERTLALKPSSASFAEAAALPLAGLTALQVCQAAQVTDGDIVLVHNASGGVGHLAVQLADSMGAATVIGTTSEHNFDFVKALGALPMPYGDDLERHVRDLVGGDGLVDVALDFVAGQAAGQSDRLVRQQDRHVSVVDPDLPERGGRYVFARPDGVALGLLASLMDGDRLLVHVQDVLALADAAKAHRMIEEGHVRGKLVLRVP